jgi:hypothetical protein
MRLVRARRTPSPTTRAGLERDYRRRCVEWAFGSATTWSIWAMTGAPTGVPRVVSSGHGVVATLGIWPLYLMGAGFLDLGRRAYRLYGEHGAFTIVDSLVPEQQEVDTREIGGATP